MRANFLSKSWGILLPFSLVGISLAPAPVAHADPIMEAEAVKGIGELSDVKPSDWAFQALDSLVQKYNCIAGYPNRTFRGNRALTRYEFAAGLNSCLNTINKEFEQGLAGKVSKEDLQTMIALQQEYNAELKALSPRIATLESQTQVLQNQVFSPTTKLNGLIYINYTGSANSSGAVREVGARDPLTNKPIIARNDSELYSTFSTLVWLNFTASFTGKDALITQLAVGNGISPANRLTSATTTVNNTGIPFTDAAATLVPSDSPTVILRELAYEFPIDNTRWAIGPRINWFRFFDANRFTFFLDGTTSLNQIANPLLNDVRRGTGVIGQIPLTKQIDLAVGYLAESNEFLASTSAQNTQEGLTGGTNSLTAELTFKLDPNLNLRFLYNRLNTKARQGFVNGAFSTNTMVSGVPINGLADDGFGGSLRSGQTDVFAFNFDWLAAPKLGFFGRYGFATTNLIAFDPARNGSITTQAFQFGGTVFDVVTTGDRATLAFVMPFNYTQGRRFLVSGAGDGGVQYELEGTYFFPISQNVQVVPNVQIIYNLNNFSSNPTVYIGNVRTQFAF